MGTVSVSLPSDGSTIDAADYNVPINTIVAEINGGLDSDNIEVGGVIPNSLLAGTGTSWAWQSWTPTLTNITIGSGTVTAKYTQIGKTVHFRLRISLSSTTMGTSPQFSVPVAMNSGYSTTHDPILNSTVLWDNSAGTAGRFTGTVVWVDANTLEIRYIAGTLIQTAISSGAPFTWANSDEIVVSGTYEAT